MRTLFLSNWFPYPPINGAKIRIYNLIRELAADHEISLFAFVRTFPMGEAQKQIPFLSPYAKRIQALPAPSFDGKAASKMDLLSPLPRSVVQTYSKEMEDLVFRELAEHDYDVAVASEVGPPGIVSLLASRIKSIPVIVDAIEVAGIKEDYESASNAAARLRRGLTWMKTKRFTRNTVGRAAASTVPSLIEENNIRGIVGDRHTVEMIPHGLDIESFAGPFDPPRPNTLVFTGSLTYEPNGDAVAYFLDRIYPILKKLVPDVSLTVLGHVGDVDLKRFEADKSLKLAGQAPDVRQFVARSWLSIVPLRLGAGTRLKIVESMALGTPVISTSKGAEGLAVTHGEDILIADDPATFAAAAAKVIRDADQRRRLSENGRRLVSAKYSAKAMGESVSTLMERVCQGWPVRSR